MMSKAKKKENKYMAKKNQTSFRRKVFVSGHFEPVIEHTNADAPDTQLKKDSFIASLIRTTAVLR